MTLLDSAHQCRLDTVATSRQRTKYTGNPFETPSLWKTTPRHLYRTSDCICTSYKVHLHQRHPSLIMKDQHFQVPKEFFLKRYQCSIFGNKSSLPNLFTKSLDTTSPSLQQHMCWELFYWSLYKMHWLE